MVNKLHIGFIIPFLLMAGFFLLVTGARAETAEEVRNTIIEVCKNLPDLAECADFREQGRLCANYPNSPGCEAYLTDDFQAEPDPSQLPVSATGGDVTGQQPGGDVTGQQPGGDVTGGGGCGSSSGGLTNPLNSCTIMEFLGKIIDIILVFALPIIIFFIMYGGFMLVTANGEPAKLTKGRDAILWAVVGGVIALGAKIISSVIQSTVNQLTL